MWPFRQVPDGAHLELVSQIHGLLQRVQQLEEDLAALQANHERLRGRFYALKGPAPEDRALTKAEILARMVPRRT